MREGLVLGEAGAEGIDPGALENLVTLAKTEKSEALVILKNGKLVFEDYFGGKDEPIMAMSASKSFVSIAFGLLLAEGKLGSLDDLVVSTVPTFAAADPRKATMTYRHLIDTGIGLASAGTLWVDDVKSKWWSPRSR